MLKCQFWSSFVRQAITAHAFDGLNKPACSCAVLFCLGVKPHTDQISAVSVSLPEKELV